MCWYGNLTDKKIATKDMVCYKVIAMYGGQYYAYYRGTEYHIGETYEEEVHPIRVSMDNATHNLYKGLHCYSHLCNFYIRCASNAKCFNVTKPTKAFMYLGVKGIKGERLIGQYCISNLYTYDECGNEKLFVKDAIPELVKCIIPEGTVYYENERGEIVTTKFILSEVVREGFGKNGRLIKK